MADNTTSNKEHPLAGVVLCFTSILPEQRTDLAAIASQMGATHKYDLTSDVTHLLVGEVNTPKYKFVARERSDVIVLKPEWVESVRQSWMQGEDTDIRGLEEQYKLPPFAGLSICITGFEDMAFREYAQAITVSNGGEFRKDLTKRVTHLVALNTEGQKYKFATQWNIKVVSVKWFMDSIDRGMALEEARYHPNLPEEQQGVGAWNRKLPPVKEKSQNSDNSSNPRPRKLRRIASAKLGDQNEGIWGDIVGTGFDNPEPKAPNTNAPKPDDQAPQRTGVIQEAKSFASETTFAEVQESHQQPPESIANARDGFLQGCYFLIHGFSQKQRIVLRNHLSFNGAQLVDSLSDFSRPEIPKTGNGLYIIVSHRTPRSEIPSTDDSAFECEVVTDMWLERCLDARSLVPPESHVASTPVPKFPIPGFQGMKICSTGFSRIDLLHLAKLVNLMGASYNEYLTPNVSVLLCNDPQSVNSEKLRHTHEWGVPTVSSDWLWISIQAAQKKPLEPYIVRKQLSRSSSSGLDTRAGSHAGQDRSGHARRDTGDSLPGDDREVDSNTRTVPVPRESNNGHKQPQPPYGDGFSKDKSEVPQNQASVPESRSPSPAKQPGQTAEPSPTKEPNQSAFNLAVSGLLKQARAAKSRSGSETSEKNDSSSRPRRRKPLVGKGGQTAFSRASSIDTLNDDGCGSAIESVTNDGGPTRTNSRGGRMDSFNSIVNDTRFEFSDTHHRGTEEEDGEDQTPAMTQLNYEDPDAVAMREQFLSYAGKLINKPAAVPEKRAVGEIRELEDVGWGTGRRTRNAGKAAEG